QRLANGAQRLGKFLDRVNRRHIAGLEMHRGDAAIIAGYEAIENFREESALLEAEPPHDAKVDRDDSSGLVDEKIALVHVGVEKAVAHGVAQKGLHHVARQIL